MDNIFYVHYVQGEFLNTISTDGSIIKEEKGNKSLLKVPKSKYIEITGPMLISTIYVNINQIEYFFYGSDDEIVIIPKGKTDLCKHRLNFSARSGYKTGEILNQLKKSKAKEKGWDQKVK